MLDEQTTQQLIKAALAARQQAYAPYSNFFVGAAVLSEEGAITSGANVENASYGVTLCAERVAASAAVASGVRKLSAVAIATTGAASPCGACRQFLSEFGWSMDIILVDAEDPSKFRTTSLDVLLPEQFDLDSLS